MLSRLSDSPAIADPGQETPRSHLRSAHEMTLLTTASSRKFYFAYCCGVFTVSALSVLPFVRVLVLPNEDDSDVQVALTSFIGSETFPDLWPFVPWLAAALVMAVGISVFAWIIHSSRSGRWLIFAVPIGLLVVGLAQALEIPGLNRVEVYGDFVGLETYLSDTDGDFGRWLLGLAFLREIFAAVNAFLFEVDGGQFIRATSSLAMFAWAAWLLSRRERSSVPWLVIISPMWILFSLGYSEYYPYVAGLLVAVSWQVISQRRLLTNTTLYVLVGVMPILYIGAVPVSLALLIYVWSAESEASGRLRGGLTSLISMIVGIEVGGEFKGYVSNLAETMNLGGQLLDKSVGSRAEALSSRSFLANPSYVFSLEHAIDIWFWLSCGIGAVVLVAALVVSRGLTRGQNFPMHGGKVHLDLRRISVLVLVGLAVFYLVFMLPLLGPTRDIDLYFVSMFVLLLYAGTRFDRAAELSGYPDLERLRLMQLSAFGFAPATMALVVFGVSR